MTIKCEYCGEEIGLFEIRYTWLEKKNNRAMHDTCLKEYKKNPEKINQPDGEKEIQKDDMEHRKKKKILRYQYNIGIVFAILGVFFFLSTLISAFEVPGFYSINPLIVILCLAIGFWLCYKAEKERKKLRMSKGK
jgi:hypothetical protein